MLADPFLVGLTAALIQCVVKPAITRFWLPAGSPYQNNVTRAAVGLVAYVLVLDNAVAVQPMTYALAWSLLPHALSIAAAAIATYHVLSDATVPALGAILPPVDASTPAAPPGSGA